MNDNGLTEEEKEGLRKDLERKIRIISWLLPRFHKGISNPSNYSDLIGRCDDN
tara:strand:+ start:81 stop:239 length:159 start_codon:yes stop_codon:yes gene_type:complete